MVIGPKVVGPLVEALILASRWAQSIMLRRLGPRSDNLRGTVMSGTRPGEYLGNALGSIAVEQHTASIVCLNLGIFVSKVGPSFVRNNLEGPHLHKKH